MTCCKKDVLAVALVLIACMAPSLAGELGSTSFENSGAPEAQAAFTRGLLLLHSFEYEDAREAFQEARRLDPAFAMAYWGEAMTHNHPLWRQQDRDAALAALKELAPTPEERQSRTPTERERAYMHAVETLYGDGEKVARDVAYSEAMGSLSARYPDDLDAKAFYSLSILGIAQGERDARIYMKAGAVAEEVFAANPDHPGAAHYMIHSYDDPIHAPLGLRAARIYAGIAPAASHAQHMISHIYVALGQWADSVDANVKAFDVSVKRRKAKSLDVDELSYHSLQWLHYSYLQLGRFEDAREKLEMMDRYAAESGTARALWHQALMRAAWIVETGGREAPAEMKPEETPVTGAAATIFATGLAALGKGDLDTAARAVERMNERNEIAAAGHLCGQTQGLQETTRSDLTIADVMQKSLRGLVQMARGETEKALASLAEATADEESLPLDFGPPVIVKPSHEILGEMLLKLQRPAEAAAQFRKALERAPRRSLSLAGLATASSLSGEEEVVAKSCAELAAIYAGADPSAKVPGACSGDDPAAVRAGRK